jgi:septum formation protein
MHIYLASQSPRRRELLRQIGVTFELLLPGIDENAEALEAELPGEAPLTYVKRVVQAKARAAQARLKARKRPVWPILVADTTVAMGRQILGKPASAAQHTRMLQTLSGGNHRVLTGIAVVRGTQIESALSISTVSFDKLSETDIVRYVQSGEGTGKAGGYAIQGLAAQFVTRISGSYSGIMGLPLHQTAALLGLRK